jgi:hypothetical protein
MKASSSDFYKVPGIAGQLAARVDAGFPINAIPDPRTSNPGSNGTKGGAANGSGSSAASRTRQDAIIGVVSALGGIAICVLVFLVYRSFKRRQELAHRRMSDPPQGYVGERPDRDFDQDSVGGQRRRSFYFAEDSLSYAAQQEQAQMRQMEAENPFSDPNSARVVQRRVAPTAISAPILQQSSMNW